MTVALHLCLTKDEAAGGVTDNRNTVMLQSTL